MNEAHLHKMRSLLQMIISTIARQKVIDFERWTQVIDSDTIRFLTRCPNAQLESSVKQKCFFLIDSMFA